MQAPGWFCRWREVWPAGWLSDLPGPSAFHLRGSWVIAAYPPALKQPHHIGDVVPYTLPFFVSFSKVTGEKWPTTILRGRGQVNLQLIRKETT